MSVTTDKPTSRHLAVVPDTGRDHIEELDALHATACDTYDLATADLDAARDALTEAARALIAAEDAWSKAGTEMDAAARADIMRGSSPRPRPVTCPHCGGVGRRQRPGSKTVHQLARRVERELTRRRAQRQQTSEES